MDRKMLTLIAAICGGVATIACFLPWVSVELPSGLGARFAAAAKSANVFDLNVGFLIFVGALGGLAAALIVHLGKTKAVPLDARQLLLLGAGLFGLAAIITVLRCFSGDFKSETTPLGTVGVVRGIGLYLALLTTIGGTVTAFLAAGKKSSS